MFLLRRPAPSAINRFIDESRDLPLSYADVGITKTTVPSVHEYLAIVGNGQAAFARARQALVDWKQFDLGWVELHPQRSSIDVGANVAVLIKHLGFWSLNGCRVVFHSVATPTHFGYAYGTLTTHGESGEELFEVFLDPNKTDVIYRIRVTAKPQALLAQLGAPYVAMLQARFRRDSAAAMRRAVNSLTP